MFGPFSDSARQAMVNADCVANEAGHEYVGTAHILVGILDDDSAIPSRALSNIGVDVSALRSVTEESIKAAEGNETTEPKRAIEFALTLATSMNHEHVDCDHFLLGLLQENDGMAAQLLSRHGVTFEAASAEVARLREAGR